MKQMYKMRNFLFQLTFLLLVITRSAYAQEFIGPTFLGQMINLCIIIIVLLYGKSFFRYQDKWSLLYVFIMSLGFIFHFSLIPLKANFMEFLSWSFLIMLATYLKNNSNQHSNLIIAYVFAFILLNSGIAIWEQINKTRFVEYSYSEILDGFVMTGDKINANFRSFSLLGHPLNNANVTTICLGFVLACNNIKDKIWLWYLLIILLSLSIWAFNSRAAMLVGGILLIYRFAFYNANLFKVITSFFILYLTLPVLIEFVNNTEILGRFSLDFSDNSTLARLESFYFFFHERWDFESLILGGRILYMPGTDLLLENGILLNIGYWGIVVGLLKILVEIIISYHFLFGYQANQKIMIMMALWGTALANNNTFNAFILTFFFAICISFQKNKV